MKGNQDTSVLEFMRVVMDKRSIRKIQILGFIPARGNSEGVPGKNKKKLCGKMLVEFTIEAALKSRLLNRVVVSTEDPEIAKRARILGAEVPYLRHKELATATSALDDVAYDIVSYYETHENFRVDLLVTMLPTSPFKTPELIDAVINKAFRGVSLTTGMAKLKSHPHRCLVFDASGQKVSPLMNVPKSERCRSQLPMLFRNCMSVTANWIRAPRLIRQEYIERILKFKLHANRFLPDDIRLNFKIGMQGIELDGTMSIDIDEPLDFLLAEAAAESGMMARWTGCSKP